MKINVNLSIDLPNAANMPSGEQILEWLQDRLNSGEVVKLTKNPLSKIKLSAVKESISFNVPPQQDDKYEQNFSDARKVLREIFGRDSKKWALASVRTPSHQDYKIGPEGLTALIEGFGKRNLHFTFYVHGFRSLIEDNHVCIAVEDLIRPLQEEGIDHAAQGREWLAAAFGDRPWATIQHKTDHYQFQTVKLQSNDPVTGLQQFAETLGTMQKPMFVAGDEPLIDDENQVTFAFIN